MVACDRARSRPATPARTALLLTTPNVPGALLRVLEPLAAHGINLSKLESRPADEPWHYRFFLELDHPAGSSNAAAAIDAMRAASEVLRVARQLRQGVSGESIARSSRGAPLAGPCRDDGLDAATHVEVPDDLHPPRRHGGHEVVQNPVHRPFVEDPVVAEAPEVELERS